MAATKKGGLNGCRNTRNSYCSTNSACTLDGANADISISRPALTAIGVGHSMLAVFETIGKEKSILRLKSQIARNLSR